MRRYVGEWVAVVNSCEGLRQTEIQSIQQKTAWLNTKRFRFSGCLCNAQRQPEMLAPQQRKEWVWRRYAMFCFRLRTWLKQPETPSTQQKPFGTPPTVLFSGCISPPAPTPLPQSHLHHPAASANPNLPRGLSHAPPVAHSANPASPAKMRCPPK